MSRKFFQPFLAGEINEDAARKHFQRSGTCSEYHAVISLRPNSLEKTEALITKESRCAGDCSF